jgi:hypothetical protein
VKVLQGGGFKKGLCMHMALTLKEEVPPSQHHGDQVVAKDHNAMQQAFIACFKLYPL